MLSKEQTSQIKEQIIEHINTTFPEDRKSEAINQIENMDDKQFEDFLIQNKMIKEDGTLPDSQGADQCIFCSIVSGQAQAYKIDENKEAVAVLEINPISRAHSIIIPKKHISSSKEMPEEAINLARKISEKIKKIFNPKETIIKNVNLFGHEIINILPVYKDETLDSEKKQANSEDLVTIQDQLTKPEPKVIDKDAEQQKIKEEVINEKNTWLPKRIP